MAALGHFVARGTTQIWIPASYEPSKRWPAILFLHGSGERGSDGEKQTTVGLGPWLRNGTLDPQAIIVFPQCPSNQRWISAPEIAIEALDEAEREFSIDRSRVALTGISMGGAGVWFLAAKYPKRWSALAPVSGYIHRPPNIPDLGNTTEETFDQFARRLPKVPIWIFHGTEDPVVPVDESREMARALAPRAGYTEFAHTGHNAWDAAYSRTHVIDWLVDQKRQRRPRE